MSADLRLTTRGLSAVQSPAVTAIRATSQDHEASMSRNEIYRSVVSLRFVLLKVMRHRCARPETPARPHTA
jgi:hypothetical protein